MATKPRTPVEDFLSHPCRERKEPVRAFAFGASFESTSLSKLRPTDRNHCLIFTAVLVCATARAQAKITSLRVYPVKSCAGHEVRQATLGDRGLDMDRLWMIIDGAGRFMSQRRCAKMAVISPSLPRTKDEVSFDGVVQHKNGPSFGCMTRFGHAARRNTAVLAVLGVAPTEVGVCVRSLHRESLQVMDYSSVACNRFGTEACEPAHSSVHTRVVAVLASSFKTFYSTPR